MCQFIPSKHEKTVLSKVSLGKILSTAACLYVILHVLVAFSDVKSQLAREPFDLQDISNLKTKYELYEDLAPQNRVVFFGPSAVLGQYLKQTNAKNPSLETLPAQLQTSLGSSYQVFNFGFDGARPRDILEVSRGLPGPPPAVVLLGINLRQLTLHSPLLSRPWLSQHNSLEEKIQDWIFQISAPLRYRSSWQQVLWKGVPEKMVEDRAYQIRSETQKTQSELVQALQQKEILADVETSGKNPKIHDLVELIRFWRQKGVKLVAFYHPDNPASLPELIDANKYQEHLTRLKVVIEGQGVLFFDSLSPISSEEFVDHVHLKPEANKKMALAISRLVLNSSALEIETKNTESLTPPTVKLEKGENLTPEKEQLFSYSFFALAFLLIIATHLSSSFSLRHGLYASLSLVWLFMIVESWTSIGMVILFVASGYIWAKFFLRRTPSKFLFRFALLFTFILFLCLNYGARVFEESGFGSWVRILGISYAFFRMVQVLVDSYAGDLKKLELLPFIGFLFGILTLYAGPLMRYQEFASHWSNDEKVMVSNPLDAFLRIGVGFFKKVVLAAAFIPWIRPPMEFAESNPSEILIFFYGCAIYLYLDFSGYCDIVIGLGRLMGLRIPENFQLPFLATSPVDFWKRWHMTLREWIQIYIFTPLARTIMISNVGSNSKLTLTLVYLVTFTLIGLWHATSGFFAWALVTAVAIIVTKILESVFAGRISFSRPWRWLAVVVTFHFVAYSFSLAFLKVGQMRAYHERLISLAEGFLL